MLTKNEIDEYHRSLLPHFVRITDHYVSLHLKSNFDILMSNDSYGRIIALSSFYKSLRAIQRGTMEFGILPETNFDDPVVFPMNECWKWRLEEKNNLYYWRESYDFNTLDEVYEAILDVQKVAAIDFILSRVKRNSRIVSRYLPSQEEVYFVKYLEAKDFVDGKERKYLFIHSLNDAKNVILQYEIRMAKVAEFENARIKYTNMIKQENDISRLNDILKAYASEREY
jgi:hypothetical protein